MFLHVILLNKIPILSHIYYHVDASILVLFLFLPPKESPTRKLAQKVAQEMFPSF